MKKQNYVITFLSSKLSFLNLCMKIVNLNNKY